MHAEGEDLASLCQGTLFQQYGWFSDEWDVQRNLRFCDSNLAYAVAMEIEGTFKEKGVCHGCIRHGLVVSFPTPINWYFLLRGVQAIDWHFQCLHSVYPSHLLQLESGPIPGH